MEQEKFGKFIKEIRKKHNLTQKEFADKYNVTYQAVSKWENGLNMPDTLLMKQISKDFDISMDELIEGEYKNNKSKKKVMALIILVVIVFLGIVSLIIFNPFNNDDFHFKTLSTACENFTISGNISYNKNKSAIYITNIKYCGGDDIEEYKNIECILYEVNEDTETKISSFKSKNEKIKLEDFLEDVTLSVETFEKACEYYEEDSLYLAINATDYNNKITTYKIPLRLNNCLD